MKQLQLEKEHEWLTGLNNRLIDMNERLIEQRGQDQKERELLLTLVHGMNHLKNPLPEDQGAQSEMNGYSFSHLVSGKDFQPITPPPALSELFMRPQSVSVFPAKQVAYPQPTVKPKLVSGADFCPNQSSPKLSGLFLSTIS